MRPLQVICRLHDQCQMDSQTCLHTRPHSPYPDCSQAEYCEKADNQRAWCELIESQGGCQKE